MYNVVIGQSKPQFCNMARPSSQIFPFAASAHRNHCILQPAPNTGLEGPAKGAATGPRTGLVVHHNGSARH